MEEFEPIFDFKPLREFLVDKGYIVEQAKGYREICPEEVTVDSINRGEIEFTDEGIYVIGPGEDKQQVYLYKRDYHLEHFGKPRFHVCKCRTIEEFIANGRFREHYVRANSDPVPVRNIDNAYKEEMVDQLPLCQNCSNRIRQYGYVNSSQFVDLLRQARGCEEEPEVQEVDIFGYTKDWDNISRNYREFHEYACEECGLVIDDLFDRQYIHVHHMDGNKLNNKESNLRCLCLRCHAEVDERHWKNLTTGANGVIWKDFCKKYNNGIDEVFLVKNKVTQNELANYPYPMPMPDEDWDDITE